MTCASGEWHQLERYAMAPDRIWMGSVLHSTRLQVHYLLPLWLNSGLIREESQKERLFISLVYRGKAYLKSKGWSIQLNWILNQPT